MRLTYLHAAAIVCVSKGIADDLRKYAHVAKNVRVIYNPIIHPELLTLAQGNVEHSWFLDKNIPVVMASGRLVKAKDFPMLLRAFARLRSIKEARLVFLGEGEERASLQALSEDLGVAADVEFIGFQENPYAFMGRACVFALSSFQEGFPTVLVEAMACGVPVVSTNCHSGPNEVIRDGVNGFLVPVGNSEALAQALLRVISDEDLRNRFREAGKQTARHFEIKKNVLLYEQLFYEILG